MLPVTSYSLAEWRTLGSSVPSLQLSKPFLSGNVVGVVNASKLPESFLCRFQDALSLAC